MIAVLAEFTFFKFEIINCNSISNSIHSIHFLDSLQSVYENLPKCCKFAKIYNKTVKLQTNLRKIKMAKYHLKTWFLLCNQEKLQIFSKLS